MSFQANECEEECFMVHKIPNCGFANTYVVSESGGLMVVDVGSIGAAQDVENYVCNQPGMSLDMVKYITATHFHIDHIGGIAVLLKKCPPTTKVLFHQLVKSYLEGRKKLSLIRNWCCGLLPAAVAGFGQVKKISHLGFAGLAGIPLPVLRNITNIPYDRQRISYFGPAPNRQPPATAATSPGISLGFDQWEYLETPGHTEDSVSFFNGSSEELICGDLIINRGESGSGELNRFHWDRNKLTRSYEMLSRSIACKTIYPGHGKVLGDNGNPLEKVRVFQA
jgi:glyoxylase-like metal-dependent hydrolase (beta-lactamase superfamily II)